MEQANALECTQAQLTQSLNDLNQSVDSLSLQLDVIAEAAEQRLAEEETRNRKLITLRNKVTALCDSTGATLYALILLVGMAVGYLFGISLSLPPALLLLSMATGAALALAAHALYKKLST